MLRSHLTTIKHNQWLSLNTKPSPPATTTKTTSILLWSARTDIHHHESLPSLPLTELHHQNPHQTPSSIYMELGISSIKHSPPISRSQISSLSHFLSRPPSRGSDFWRQRRIRRRWWWLVEWCDRGCGEEGAAAVASGVIGWQCSGCWWWGSELQQIKKKRRERK